MTYYLQEMNGVVLILNGERTIYHIPSFLYEMIPYGATMTDDDFRERIKTEMFKWHPVPEGARFAQEPIAKT